MIRKAVCLLAVLLMGCTSAESVPKGIRHGTQNQALLEELRELGPSERERLDAVKVSAQEEAEIRRKIQEFRYTRRRGSAIAVRTNRRNALIAEHGIFAVRYLIEALSDPAYWRQRVSAQALEILCGVSTTADDARWLCYQLDAPKGLIAMFGTGPVSESVGLARDVDGALISITQKQYETPLEWRSAWSSEHQRWKRAEKKKDGRRTRLRKQLGE